jgi:predicted CXXCH cytochrome family protein
MVAKSRRLWWLPVLGLCGLVWLGHAAVVWPDKAVGGDGGKVVYPPDKGVLLSGTFDVITKTSTEALQLDGRPLKSEPFEPPLRVAHVRVSPGWHELRVGDRRVEFVVALNEEEHDGPADWPIHRRHPMNANANRCGDCHETTARNGQTLVGDLKSYEACFECHKSAEFEEIHEYPLEDHESCQKCHAVHGSISPSLLRAPAKKLCAECHDS